MRDDRERLQDILETIEKIEKYAIQGRHVFDTDELIQSWIVNQLGDEKWSRRRGKYLVLFRREDI